MTATIRPIRPLLLLSLAVACQFDATGLGDSAGATEGSSSTSSSGGETTTSSTTTEMSTGTMTTSTSTTASTTTSPTTTTGPGVCGDGTLDPGEACDNGAMNADNAACKSNCMINVCGDGALGPGEGCDDGNTVSGDGCSDTCASESCGDGKIDAGEACDDGNQTNDDGCTNACTLPICGDGILQGSNQEECDNSGDNGPSKACTGTCKSNVCGDGNPYEGVEECDDGNGDNTDECVDGCKAATCGDKFVHSGVEACDDGNENVHDECVSCVAATCGDGKVWYGKEQCDDGNDVDTDDCLNSCKINGTYVFVTSDTVQGNFGGIGAADTKCMQVASGKGFQGTWKAWLSDASGSPAINFVQSTKGYFLLNGAKIANNWAGLTSGSILAAINVNENFANWQNGQTTGVWTGTTPNGMPDGADCMGWTSNMMSHQGLVGRRDQQGSGWTADQDSNCNTPRRFYCFQQ